MAKFSTEFKSDAWEGNMAGWLLEKAESTVEALAAARDTLNELAEMSTTPLGLQRDLEMSLHVALYNSTKMLAAAAGSTWQAEDAYAIFRGGSRAAEEVFAKYGLAKLTPEQRSERDAAKLRTKLRVLIGGNRVPNRTFIHEALSALFRDESLARHRDFQTIADMVEEVTNGEMQWEEFVERARFVLGED